MKTVKVEIIYGNFFFQVSSRMPESTVKCRGLLLASVVLICVSCVQSWIVKDVLQQGANILKDTVSTAEKALTCTHRQVRSAFDNVMDLLMQASKISRIAFAGLFLKLCNDAGIRDVTKETQCGTEEEPFGSLTNLLNTVNYKLPDFNACIENGAKGENPGGKHSSSGSGGSSSGDGKQPTDCSEVLANGNRKSGVYPIWLNVNGDKKRVEVFCDMETQDGGWTLIQRRGNYSELESFDRDWETYKNGFGSLDKEFWLGNDNIFALTNQAPYALRFDLEDQNGEKGYAVYQPFWIENEAADYKLHIYYDYGNIGESMMLINNEMGFTTKDRANDGSTSGEEHVRHRRKATPSYDKSKGGWWYRLQLNNGGSLANLNGVYTSKVYAPDLLTYIFWYTWRGFFPLNGVEMKLKPIALMPKY